MKKTPESIASLYSFTLTALRKNILAILLNAQQPLKAYDILEQLKKTHKNAEPPTVYRVLDFFVKNHIIHRIESSHAYILCHSHKGIEATDKQKHIIMLCQTCHSSQEVFDSVMHTLIDQITSNQDFHMKSNFVELIGFCEKCYNIPKDA